MKRPQKSATHVNFDSKALKEFMEQDNSCIEMKRSKQHLALHPFHLNELNSSIKEIFNQGVPKYNKDLEGILFGYQNITFVTDVGAIFNDTCFVHLDVEADFFVFKPTIGSILQGVVNKKSKDHLGCLVHKTFNVSLPKPEHDKEGWIGHSIVIGSEISLRVIYTCYDGRLPYIRGTIESIISQPEELPENTTKIPGSKKKINKVIKFDDEEPDDNVADDDVSPKKKKSKKLKLNEESGIETDESPKKKKSKKLKSNEYDDASPAKKKKTKRSRSDDESETDAQSKSPKKKRRKDSS